MNVDGCTEVVQNLVERPESGVVAPAIDVGGLDVKDFFSESFGDELRDTGLAGAARPGDDGGVGRLSVRDGLENAREVIDFGVAMLDFLRDEPSAEDASIPDHLYLVDGFFS